MGRSPESVDFIVFGLGNPGAEYARTRHNLGVMVVDALAGGSEGAFRAGAGSWVERRFTEGRRTGVLARSLLWMNRCGESAREVLDSHAVAPEDFLAVSDDLDLPLGRVRFRRDGGEGGHRGIRSVIEALGTEAFPRLRLGIGRPEVEAARAGVVEHVLDAFREEEREAVDRTVAVAVDGVRFFLREGVDAAMNEFNAG
ncbi:MAG: aminoacyl-tRNA hydrolase [Gemmatimonadota bacterium]|nr:aminoacyl-tRNA hydrolase [Gemmatimonadota bacterium]MDP7031747.1 aminoacyl-tRNA hydrolase [Gemmatimonadota bacterium]